MTAAEVPEAAWGALPERSATAAEREMLLVGVRARVATSPTPLVAEHAALSEHAVGGPAADEDDKRSRCGGTKLVAEDDGRYVEGYIDAPVAGGAGEGVTVIDHTTDRVRTEADREERRTNHAPQLLLLTQAAPVGGRRRRHRRGPT